jgi:type I restriction enzyme S subunit
MDLKTFFNNFETIANAPGGIIRLRELILDLAVRGKLIDQRDISSWQNEIQLREVGKMIRGVTYAKAESTKNAGQGLVPLLGAANIQKEINFDGLTYVPENLIKDDQFVQDGDVLICMSSGSKHLVGKAGMISHPSKASFGAFCAVFRILDPANRDYIAMFFKSPVYRNAISQASRGIGINNLRVGDIDKISLFLPAVSEQNRTVEKVNELIAFCDELQAAQNRRYALEELIAKSITSQLFNNE